MSRITGLSSFSSNFEPKISGPLDARTVVDTAADLVSESTWQAPDGTLYVYKGMLVSVVNDLTEINGVYRLAALPITSEVNWVKLGTGEGTGGTGILVWYPDNSPPSVPEDGDAYYDTALGKSLVWSDGAWHTVANDGEDGAQGLPGEDGSNGVTPHIGLNGNWFIGETDTEIPATGPAGNDGEDGAQGLPGEDGANGVTPHVGLNGNWFIGETDTEIPAQGPAGQDGNDGAQGLPGEDGANGVTPHVGLNGNWFIGETDTDIPATGPAGEDGANGVTPHIGVGGNWFIGETDTDIPATGPAGKDGEDGAQGLPGQDGANGVTPHIDETTGNWFIGLTDTEIPATGPAGQDGAQGLPGEDGTNGVTPHIGINGNWFIGLTDTEIPATGPAGQDGQDGAAGTTPHIDETTGNWFIGLTDTDIPATGPAGKDGSDGAQGLPGEDGSNGITPHIGLNGNWFIGLTDTEIPATGPAGEDGQDGSAGIDGNSINWLGELASAPGSPVNYDAYHNTTDGNSYIYNSTASAWQTLAQRGTDGEEGADGSNGTDGVSITWLGTLASAPAEPTLSTAYYNSTAKQAYIWDGDSWETLCKDGTDGQDGADGASIFQQDITPLTGTPVSVSAGGVYSWTISAASVINKGTWADDGLEYAVMLITVEAGGSVTGGTGITLVDALVAGFNYCILRGIDGAVDLLISPE